MKLISKIKVRHEDVPDDEVIVDFIISTDDLDRHNSQMSESSLRNYAEDAEQGVPFLVEHQKSIEKQLGNTIAGAYAEGQTEASVRLLRDTDKTPDELRIDEYIRRIERGFYTSVSVGYRDAKEICSLCEKDIWDTRADNPCMHWPGEIYDGMKCTYEVRDARLAEVSLVSNPSNANAKVVERELTDDIRAIKKSPEISKSERELRKYREQIITDAIKAGVRALDDFDEESWRKRLDAQDADFIKEQTAMWDALGDARWAGNGGRKTGDVDNKTESGKIILPSFLFS